MPATGAGDLVEYTPGDGVAVEVTADASGNVALRGEMVEITGENQHVTEVSLNQTAGGAVAFLSRDPDGYTGSQSDFSSGDSAGRTEAILYKPVVWLTPDADFDPDATGTQTPSAGDEVQGSPGGGIQLFASGDASSPYGTVWNTLSDGAAPAKVQVAVYR